MRRRGVVIGVLVVISMLLIVSNVSAIEYSISEKVNKNNLKKLDTKISGFFKNKENSKTRYLNIYRGIIETIRMLIAKILLFPSFMVFGMELPAVVLVTLIYYIIGVYSNTMCVDR